MFSLKELFGKQVKVTMDESPYSDASDKLWLQEIVGRRGKIYPQSETTVCVCTTPKLGKKMLERFAPKAFFKRHGETEYELIIPLEMVKSTFRYIKPKVRRVLSDARRQALIEAGKAFRIQKTLGQTNTSQPVL